MSYASVAASACSAPTPPPPAATASPSAAGEDMEKEEEEATAAKPEPTEAELTEADGLKSEANKFFKEEKYNDSIELYGKAIELNPVSAVLYANRSIANLRIENFGYALTDANKAIENDKTYLKAYYRRAAAHMSLGKYKLALKDYERVYKVRKNDMDAKAKFTECKKIVQQTAFNKAIAVDVQERKS